MQELIIWAPWKRESQFLATTPTKTTLLAHRSCKQVAQNKSIKENNFLGITHISVNFPNLLIASYIQHHTKKVQNFSPRYSHHLFEHIFLHCTAFACGFASKRGSDTMLALDPVLPGSLCDHLTFPVHVPFVVHVTFSATRAFLSLLHRLIFAFPHTLGPCTFPHSFVRVPIISFA